MKIIKKRINKVEKYLENIKEGDKINIVYQIEEETRKVQSCGFSSKLEDGERILPASIGAVTRYNAKGKYVLLKNEEKEKRTIEREYHVVDWHGNDHYGIAYDERECYKRHFIVPPSKELTIVNIKGNKYITSEAIIKDEENYGSIKHIINLFLELFGECDILKENEDVYTNTKIKRLNWKILPKGKYPWDKLKGYVDKIIENTPQNRRNIVEENIKIISKYTPSFVAIGEGGFNGYLIYGFENRDFVILESNEIGNATYILDDKWEEISKLTKAEILNNRLERDRIIHSNSWQQKVSMLFK